jgi:flagellar protein FliS
MYPKQNGTNAYQQVSVFTADPVKLVIMCYDGAISSLRLAKEHYQEKNFEDKAKALQKAHNILTELDAALDLEKGGSVAVNLRALYQYMIRRLIEGDLKRDLTVFDEVIRMLDELGSAWREILNGTRQEIQVSPQAMETPYARNAEAGFGWRG